MILRTPCIRWHLQWHPLWQPSLRSANPDPYTHQMTASKTHCVVTALSLRSANPWPLQYTHQKITPPTTPCVTTAWSWICEPWPLHATRTTTMPPTTPCVTAEPWPLHTQRIHKTCEPSPPQLEVRTPIAKAIWGKRVQFHNLPYLSTSCMLSPGDPVWLCESPQPSTKFCQIWYQLSARPSGAIHQDSAQKHLSRHAARIQFLAPDTKRWSGQSWIIWLCHFKLWPCVWL